LYFQILEESIELSPTGQGKKGFSLHFLVGEVAHLTCQVGRNFMKNYKKRDSLS